MLQSLQFSSRNHRSKYLVKLARGVVLALVLIQVLLCCSSLNEKILEIEAHTGSGAVGDRRARHITRENARICYSGNESSWFEVYTLVAGLESHHIDAIVRNTLEWTERHGVRFCVRKYKVDASRSGSWNKVAANIEALARSKASWALSLDADALIQNYNLSPQDMLDRVREKVGKDAFASHSLFLSSEFGNKKDVNPINGGVYFMRVNRQSIEFLLRVWNEFHGMSLFYQPYYEEQAAMRRFYMRAREEFDEDAIILPFTVFNNYYKVAKDDDFLIHYAGYGVGRGAAKNRNKYDELTSMIGEKFREDDKFRIAGQDCLGQRSQASSVSCEKGITLNQNLNWFEKLMLRMFPSKLSHTNKASFTEIHHAELRGTQRYAVGGLERTRSC